LDSDVKQILRGYLILFFGATSFGIVFVCVFIFTYPPFTIPFAGFWYLFFTYLTVIISIISVVFVLLGSYLIIVEGIMIEPYRQPKQIIVISICVVLIGFLFTPIGWQFFTGLFLYIYQTSGSILALAFVTLAFNIWHILTGLFYGTVQILLGLILLRKAIRDHYAGSEVKASVH
jgi:hypothetical protein